MTIQTYDRFKTQPMDQADNVAQVHFLPHAYESQLAILQLQ